MNPFQGKKKIPSFKEARVRGAEAQLRELPPLALIGTINTMIGILKERGFPVIDWDNRDKSVYKLVFQGGKVYILLTHSENKAQSLKEASNAKRNPGE